MYYIIIVTDKGFHAKETKFMPRQNIRPHSTHRIAYHFFTVLQIIIDILIFQLCIPFKVAGETRIFITGTMSACFIYGELYGFEILSFWDETGMVLRSSVLMILVNILYLYAVKFSLSFFFFMVGTGIFIIMTLAARYFFRVIFFRAGWLVKTVIILGAGDAGKLFAEKINSSPFTIRRALCFLDDDESKKGAEFSGVKVAGTIAKFSRLQKYLHADEAIIAIPTVSRQQLSLILNMLESSIGRVLYIPDMYMLTTSVAEISTIDEMLIISSSQGLLNPVNIAVKTVIDYIGAVIALAVFSPFMIWAAWRIWREDGRPIFFIQDRVGWKGKHFRTYKFRSMFKNADEITQKLFSDPKIFADYKKGVKLKDDPRLTKTGKILRKTSIDELPQLFNVLRGEMSLVGPRPLTQSDVDMIYGEHFTKKVYAAKPGLTGIWQVSGRSDLDADFRREINCYYVHNWSVWLDIAILMKTPLAVISHKGAY